MDHRGDYLYIPVSTAAVGADNTTRPHPNL
jgi:hypothetical protein